MGNTVSQVLPSPTSSKLLQVAKSTKPRERQKPKGSISLEEDVENGSHHLDKIDLAARLIDPSDYNFPFENLVFESGRLKCLAYCGALEYLDVSGCLSNIKRVAGTGYGAMVSLLFVVGFSWEEISVVLGDDIVSATKGGIFGDGGLLSGIIRGFGVSSSGDDISEKLGRSLKEKCGNPDITFQEIYKSYKKELCVVVTNVNLMCTEYFHVKTTPHLPARTAVQMSLTIPGAYIPKTGKINGSEYVYVHGGILCTYPVHCFDGWYLSMKQENRLLQKQQPVKDFVGDKKENFKGYNDKTLGFSVYSQTEEDFMRSKLESRLGVLIPPRPSEETDLYILRSELAKQRLELEKSYNNISAAVEKFKNVLTTNQLDESELLDKKDLKRAFRNNSAFTNEDTESMFGKCVNIDMFFEKLDHKGNGMVIYEELLEKVESHGVDVYNSLRSLSKKTTTSFVSFMSVLQSAISQNTRTNYIQESDIERTVGINTGHIETEDNGISRKDVEFIIDRGYNSTRAFLQYYVAKNKCSKKSSVVHQPILEENAENPKL